MSFLIDPPLLYATGRLYGARAAEVPDRKRDALLGIATMGTFWGVSVSLYLDRRWTRPIWKLCRARSGRDWMLNSGVLSLDPARGGTATHAVSAVIFATYPYWLWRGVRDARAHASP